MKAWQFVGEGQPLTLKEVAVPEVGPGEIGVDILAAGLCHSDVGYLEGAIPAEYLGELPRTLGHEVAGRISEVGEGVEGLEVGELVAIVMGFDGPGVARDGGYGPKGVYPAELAVKVPAGVSAVAAAAATDAGRTAVHNVKNVAGVTEGTKLGIVGLGGLGLIALQAGVSLGAEVYGADVKEDARQEGEKQGAKAVVADVADLAQYELDVIIDFAGVGSTTAGSLQAVRPGGTVVLVGLGNDQATISTPDFALRGLTLKSDASSTPEHLAETLDLIADGSISPVTTEITFEEIGDGMKRVAAGDVVGRLVAVYPED